MTRADNGSRLKKMPARIPNASHSGMPLLDHIRELRVRLIISAAAGAAGAVVAYIFYTPIITFLVKPVSALSTGLNKDLHILSMFEPFMIKVRLSIICGVIVSSPLHLINITGFVFPGLTPKEKRVLCIFIFFSFLLVVSSVWMAYFQILPLTIRFLTDASFIPDLPAVKLKLFLNFERTIQYILQFVFASVILFQAPLVLEILMILNLVSRQTLLRLGRYVVVLIFMVSAILTPPDVISQVAVALPLSALYFAAVLTAYVFRFGEGGV